MSDDTENTIIQLHKSSADKTEERIADLKGPQLTGHRVIVEGRLIPLLTMHQEGDEILILLDDCLGVFFSKDVAPQAAWLVANALAIGQGYTGLSALTRDRPFAPEIVNIGALPKS